jgi:hypothetical protein
VSWFLDNLGGMFSTAFTPLIWIFNFIKGFFASAMSSLADLGIEVEEMDLMTDNLETFFNNIPYFSLILSGISGVLGIFILIFIVKKIIHV